jgi:hypothetical protein
MDPTAIFAVITALSGMALGWLGRTRTIKQDAAHDAGTVTALQTDLEYIRRGVDDIRLDQKVQGQQIVALGERIARLEEAYKSLRQRVDKIEE